MQSTVRMLCCVSNECQNASTACIDEMAARARCAFRKSLYKHHLHCHCRTDCEVRCA